MTWTNEVFPLKSAVPVWPMTVEERCRDWMTESNESYIYDYAYNPLAVLGIQPVIMWAPVMRSPVLEHSTLIWPPFFI